MNTWPTKKLGEICNSFGGGTPRRSNPDYFKGYIPWITVTDLTDDLRISRISDARQHITKGAIENSATNLVPVGSVVLATRVAVGKVGLTTRPITTNQDCTSFIPHRELTPEFLAIWFLANRNVIKSLSKGIGIMGVRRKDLENLEISLPPIEEQKRIVEKIEKLFAKIDKARRLRAESSAASAALLPSALHRVFSRAEKEGWEEKELSEVAETKMGGTPRTTNREFWNNGNIIWITPEDMKKNSINFITDSRRKITRVGIKKSSAKLFPKNTVFVSTTATIGKIGIAGKEMSANQQITGIICGPNLEPRFLAYYFLRLGEIELKKIGGQAIATHINQTNFRKLKASLPPIAEQKKIVAYLDSLSAKSRELQNLQNETATDFFTLRQSTLAKAFAGGL